VATDADEGPRILRQVPPAYPQADFVIKREGTVEVGALVDGTGRVASAWILRGASAEMNEAALASVREWTFLPARRHGRPVPVTVRASVTFRIR
jgi:TonB family protein